MPDLTLLPGDALVEFVTAQPWFHSRAAESPSARVLEVVELRSETPRLALAVVEVDVEHGRSELYQLPLGLRPADERWTESVIATVDGWIIYDGLADHTLVRTLETMIQGDSVIQNGEATVTFSATVRGEAADELFLKVYRRLDAGTHPELELLGFLTEHGFANVAPLVGSYSYASLVIDATLGVAQLRPPVAETGWTFALESMAGAPERFLRETRSLGEITREMHELLASEPGDPDFAPEDPSAEALALFEATLDEEIRTLFANLPDDEALAPIAGHGEGVRDELRLLSRMTGGGRYIRLHGNHHLGTVAWTGDSWLFIDFAGELGRTMAERRRKQSPLRDVATMLRSFAYAASAAALESGAEPPSHWEETAREGFLSGYFARYETAGVAPGGRAGAEHLLSLFELERAVYELRHEIRHRPEWVAIPVAAIRRLLEARASIAV